MNRMFGRAGVAANKEPQAKMAEMRVRIGFMVRKVRQGGHETSCPVSWFFTDVSPPAFPSISPFLTAALAERILAIGCGGCVSLPDRTEILAKKGFPFSVPRLF